MLIWDVYVIQLSRVGITLRYTTPDIHCRHRRHECDGGIKTNDHQSDRFRVLLWMDSIVSSIYNVHFCVVVS